MKDLFHQQIEQECLSFFQNNPFSIESAESLQRRIGRQARNITEALETLLQRQLLSVRKSGAKCFYELNRNRQGFNQHDTQGMQGDIRDIYVYIEKLTAREKEVVQLLLKGQTNQEIADTLYISAHTVKNHLSNIYMKLKVTDRYELLATLYQWQKER